MLMMIEPEFLTLQTTRFFYISEITQEVIVFRCRDNDDDFVDGDQLLDQNSDLAFEIYLIFFTSG